MPSPTPETSEISNRFSSPAQFIAEDQSTAFLQEISKLSQQPPALEQKPLLTSTAVQPVDQTIPAQSNAAVDNLPPVTVEQTPKPAEAKVGAWTNTVLDLSLGTAAVIAGEVALGVLTKNPKFEAMAVQTLQNGGKFALMTSPRFAAPIIASSGLSFGAATVGRHYAVEGLTGEPEPWMTSANHVAIGAAAFMATRYLGNKFSAPAVENISVPKI